MKTQIFTTRTLTTIFVLLLVAFTATQANAQRREQNNTRENTTNERRVANKSDVKERETKKEYSKPAKPDSDQDRKGYNRPERKDDNNRADRRERAKADKHRDNDNWSDRNDRGRDHHDDRFDHHKNDFNMHPAPAPDFGVHVDPPHIHDRDYMWHRHNRVSYHRLPRKAVWLTIDGENYAFYHGRFYVQSPFGFHRVIPPVYIHNLPENCLRVLIDGKPMWNLHGILFIDTPLGIKIVV